MRTMIHPKFVTRTHHLLFQHTCTIWRNQQFAVDDDNHIGPPDWVVLTSGVPCYFWTPTRAKAQVEILDSFKDVYMQEIRLHLPVDTDITEKDLVGLVSDSSGGEINPADSFLNVESVQWRPTHKHLTLSRVSAS